MELLSDKPHSKAFVGITMYITVPKIDSGKEGARYILDIGRNNMY